MNFHRTTNILIFFLLQQKNIFSTQEIHLKNDITKNVVDCTTGIFKIHLGHALKFLYPLEGPQGMEDFECNSTDKMNYFQKKIFFHNIYLQSIDLTSSHEKPKETQMYWNFSKNQVRITLNEEYKMEGAIGTDEDQNLATFSSDILMRNFVITITGSYTKNNDLKTSFNIDNKFIEGAKFSGKKLSTEDEDQFIKLAFSTIVREQLKKNKFDEIFQAYEKPKNELTSKYPDFFSNQKQYYFFINQVPLFCFNLKHIVIDGLWNFESYKIVFDESWFSTRTLLIRNVQGRMTLDYRCENETALELNFHIDCFYLVVSRMKDDDEIAHGYAKYYSVNRTKTNESLSARQSEVIINRLESAIASSLLPKMRVGNKSPHLETPPERIEISNASDWKTIKESYNEWIPFNDETKL